MDEVWALCLESCQAALCAVYLFSTLHATLFLNLQSTVTLLNIEPLGSAFFGERRKEVSIALGVLPNRNESQAVQ